MKPRTTLVLAVLLAVLCAAYWGVRRYQADQGTRTAVNQALFAFDADAVTALTIDRIDEEPVSATRDENGVWSLRAPDANIQPLQMLWDRVATNFAGLANIRTITDEPSDEQITEYGLDIPALRFSAVADDTEITLAFGSKDPTQEYRYARGPAGQVFLVRENAYFELNRKLEDMRHRFLVDNREAPIVRLEFARIWTGTETAKLENPPVVGEESPPMVVARETPESPWRVTAPVDAIADQERVQALVSEVQFGMGHNFIDHPEDLSDYGLNPPAARISVVDNVTGKAQTVLFGHLTEGDKGGMYARRPDREAVFTVEPHILTLFPKSLQDFRDRHLLTRAVMEVSKVRYVGTDNEFTLENTPDAGWRVLEDDQEANQARISSYVGSLKNITSDMFVTGADLETLGLDEPLLRIELYYPDESSPRVIRVARDPEDDQVYYATQDSGDITRLKAEEAEKLFYDPADFRSLSFMHFAPSSVEDVKMTFEGTDYRFEKRHGLWVVVAPEAHKLENQRDMALLLDVLSDVKILRGTAEEAPPEEGDGLDKPTLSVQVQLAPRENEQAVSVLGPLAVGAVVPGGGTGRFASIPTRAGVYRVDQEVITGVREALRGVVPDASN